MKLYNCYSELELELKEIELCLLENEELINLAEKVKSYFNKQEIEDYNIIIDSLYEISLELYKRTKK